ncbi:MAG: glycosyltransferase family 2 protein [Paracoccaceae bacterium]
MSKSWQNFVARRQAASGFRLTGGAGPGAGRLVVAIATMNRPGIVIDTVRALARQERLPDLVLLSATGPGDIDMSALEDLPFACEVIIGEAGLTFQRNRMIERLQPDDIMLLLDDDFLLSPDYLRTLLRLFATHPDVVVLTGTVLADGIGGPGYDHAEGERQLRALGGRPRPDTLTDIYNGYGCNMAFRARPALEHGIRFDEALPKYSWLEDVDFSRRLAEHGRIARAGALTGVHLGTKTGRSRGVPLGYSQIANPVYLMSKGTMSAPRALRMILRNLVSNVVKALRPEPWVDRRGRLRGNLLALSDLLRGRIAPDRILDL